MSTLSVVDDVPRNGRRAGTIYTAGYLSTTSYRYSCRVLLPLKRALRPTTTTVGRRDVSGMLLIAGGLRSTLRCIAIRVSVCLSVCSLAYLENHMFNLHQFLSARRRFSVLGFPQTVLPVLWMTSCFHLMGPVA